MREVEGRVGIPFASVDGRQALPSVPSASDTIFVETPERANGEASPEKPLQKMTINRVTREVSIEGEPSAVKMGIIDHALLLCLADAAVDRPGEVVTIRDLFGTAVAAGSTGKSRHIVSSFIGNISMKLGDNTVPQLIIHETNKPSKFSGYRLNADVTIVDEPARNLSRVVEEQINFDPSPLAELDPQEVARRASQHDPNVFGHLYNDNLSTIYRFVFFKVGNAQLAEDLVSDVFAYAWENINQFQWRDIPLQHWLLRIARNVVVDHWRANHRFTSSLEGTRILDGTQDPQEIAVNNWELATVRQALAHLSDDQRDVLIYRFIEGFSHEDVAKALGKSVVAIRQTQLRALRALRKVMGSLYEGSKGERRLVNGR